MTFAPTTKAERAGFRRLLELGPKALENIPTELITGMLDQLDKLEDAAIYTLKIFDRFDEHSGASDKLEALQGLEDALAPSQVPPKSMSHPDNCKCRMCEAIKRFVDHICT